MILLVTVSLANGLVCTAGPAPSSGIEANLFLSADTVLPCPDCSKILYDDSPKSVLVVPLLKGLASALSSFGPPNEYVSFYD